MINEKVLLEQIERGRKCGFCAITYDDLEERINSIPKVGEWIPCSERLPEEYTEVIGYGSDEHIWLVKLYNDSIFGKVWSQWNGGLARLECIVAWMPLPQPYKEGGA